MRMIARSKVQLLQKPDGKHCRGSVKDTEMWSTADDLAADMDNTVGDQCGNVVGARRRNHGHLQGHNTVGGILGDVM